MTTQSTRIDYIDAIKGFTILWVVIGHFGEIVPDWLGVPYRMPLFFFMSGIFFRPRPFKQFLVRRINTLLIPLAIWLAISWLYVIFKYEILAHFVSIPIDYTGPTWAYGSNYLGLFNVNNEYMYTPFAINGPLWFLLGLFNVQMMFYGLRKLAGKTWLILVACGALYIVGRVMDLCGINGLLLASTSLQFMIYYALGSIYGGRLIEFITRKSNIAILLGICLPILIFLPFIQGQFWGFNTGNLIVRTLCFIPVVFIFFSTLYNLTILKPLIFFGRNSLVVLATHILIFTVVGSIMVKALAVVGDIQELKYSIPYHIALLVIVCTADYFFIKFCNRYAPWAVGKRDVIKIKS